MNSKAPRYVQSTTSVKNPTMTTARETIAQLVKLKIDLIPLKPGEKVPMHARWNVASDRKLDVVINTLTRSNIAQADLPATEFVKLVANIGMLNESSKTVTLDCDSPLAGKALQAACAALGGDFDTLYPEASWTSVKGSKALYRRPASMAAGRTVFKVHREEGGSEVIFELRGTGQDVLPPSWREDAQQHLAWFHEPPTSIGTMPKWLAQLNAELLSGDGPGMRAMYAALGVDPAMRRPNFNMKGYPPALAAFPTERAYINANYSVPDLLVGFGYIREGKRYKPSGSPNQAGIVAPRTAAENWICEHESDVLAGVFDAWRVIVEHAYSGDVAAAAKETAVEQRKKLSTVPHVDSEQDREPPPPEHKPDLPPRKERPKLKVVDPVEQEQDVPVEQPSQRRRVHNQFLIEKHESIRPVVDGHISVNPGAHLLSAMPKAGKSTLITAMALTATTGVSLSGFKVLKPVPVLYCAFDENIKHNLQPRMRALALAHKLPLDLVNENLDVMNRVPELDEWAREENIDIDAPLDIEYQPDMALSDVELAERAKLIRPRFSVYTRALYHYLRTNKIRLCLIDVIGSMRVSAPMGKSVYERDLEEFLALNAIGVAANCAIIGVHHMNKAAAGALANSHPLAKVSGTNAIAGAVQSIISMSHPPLEKGSDPRDLVDIEPVGFKIVIEQTSRDSIGLDATAFSMVKTQLEDEDTPALEWVFMGAVSDVLSKHDERSFIVTYLGAQPAAEYVPAAQVFQAAAASGSTSSRSADTFRRLMSRMARAGQLESRQGANAAGYRLAPPLRVAEDAKRAARKF